MNHSNNCPLCRAGLIPKPTRFVQVFDQQTKTLVLSESAYQKVREQMESHLAREKTKPVPPVQNTLPKEYAL